MYEYEEEIIPRFSCLFRYFRNRTYIAIAPVRINIPRPIMTPLSVINFFWTLYSLN